MMSFSNVFSFQQRSVRPGLLDRAGLAKAAQAEMQRAAQTGEPLALMLVEIDHFDSLRSARGAAAVNRVLETLTAVLREVCGETVAVARLRSQEFAVLLPGRSREELYDLAELVRASTPEVMMAEEGQAITVSIGVGMHYRGESIWVQMLSRADVALFCAKSGGCNRVVMDTGTSRRVEERRGRLLRTAA